VNIAFLITRGDDIGGAQIHVRDLAVALSAAGHDVTVVAGGKGALEADLAKHGIAYRSVRRLAVPVAPVRDSLATLEVVRALHAIKPDILSAHTAKAGFIGRVAAAALGIPAVYTPHGWAITNRISPRAGKVFRCLEKLAGLVSARIVNVCQFEADLALREHVVRADKLTVVFNGLPDVPESLRAAPARHPPRLLMTARMAPPKDHPILLASLAGLKHLPWTVDLAGDGPFETGLRRQAAELGIEDRVRFLGFCGDPEARVREAQIFVLASRFEAFPYSILEAMRAGLPVVASDAGGIREAVVGGETGLLAPVGNAAALREHLARLIADPVLRAGFGAAGRRRYLARFRFDRMFRETLAIYQGVARPRTAEGVRVPLPAR